MITKRFNLLILKSILLVLLCGCSFVWAEQDTGVPAGIQKDYQREGIKVTYSVDRAIANITHAINVQFDIEQDISIESELVLPDKLKDNFELVQEPVKITSQADSTSIDKKISLKLTPRTTGKVEIAGVSIEFWPKGKDGEKTALEIEPVEIQISSLLSEQDKELISQKGMNAFLDSQFDDKQLSMPDYRAIALWLICAAFVIIIIVAIIIRKIYKSRQPVYVFRKVHEIASDMLSRLEELKLIEKGQKKIYYARTCQILRYYIECRFAVKAPEMTTEEFLDHIRNRELFKEDVKSDLQQFFNICDMVKFAKFEPDTVKIQQSSMLVQRFIDGTADDECQIEVTRNDDYHKLLEVLNESV